MDRRVDQIATLRGVVGLLAQIPDARNTMLEDSLLVQRLASLPDARFPVPVPLGALANLGKLFELGIERGETNRLGAMLGEHPKNERRPGGARNWCNGNLS